jgi:hypothetical protein
MPNGLPLRWKAGRLAPLFGKPKAFTNHQTCARKLSGTNILSPGLTSKAL